ncbi:toll/interleukin-1 receptor domain-containing protein [Streptomyces sp. NPDC058008]|uniref:toll/interleukin-1 receptor domain-containing protein n=1 Tax=Streptomyces sp. NPDC058008 TaxID=3346303 RepID=UPI0036E689A6
MDRTLQLRYFVSYARRDNSTERLQRIASTISDASHIYIDDLEHHSPDADRVKAVVDALMRADVFLAVQSTHYLRTEWTRWEMETALHGGAEVRALLLDWRFAHRGTPNWPWPGGWAGESAVAAS